MDWYVEVQPIQPSDAVVLCNLWKISLHTHSRPFEAFLTIIKELSEFGIGYSSAQSAGCSGCKAGYHMVVFWRANRVVRMEPQDVENDLTFMGQLLQGEWERLNTPDPGDPKEE
jgi:hypothetical protein